MLRARLYLSLLAAVLAFVAVPGASADTIRLNWTEMTPAGFGYPVMVFSVRSITWTTTSWSVTASVTNRSRSPVKVHTSGTSKTALRFGLRLPPSVCRYHRYPSCLGGGPIAVAADAYAPQVPAVLGPGQSWSGTFTGHSPLRKGMRVAVTFGYFVAPIQKQAFSWVTSHTLQL